MKAFGINVCENFEWKSNQVQRFQRNLTKNRTHCNLSFFNIGPFLRHLFFRKTTTKLDINIGCLSIAKR